MKKLTKSDLESLQFAVVQIQELLLQARNLRKQESRRMTHYETPAAERRAFVAGVEAVENLLSAQSSILEMELAEGRSATSPGWQIGAASKRR